MDSKLLLTGS